VGNPAQRRSAAYSPGGRREAATWPTTAPAKCPSVDAMRLQALGIPRIDLVIAAALIALLVVGTTGAQQGQPDRESLDALGYALLVLMPLALTVWRRHAKVAVSGVAIVALVYLGLEYPYGPWILCLVLGLVAAIGQGERIAAIAAAVVIYAGHFLEIWLFDLDPGVSLGSLAGVASWEIVTLTGGELLRIGIERRRERALVREEERRRRADEERLAIARDLHDVLAHSISLINVQAGVALHLIDEQPEQARTALAAIKEASGEALREVRSALGTLRGAGESAPRAPAPSLSRLNELVSGAEGVGLRVAVEVTGRARPLPVEVDQAAFRIVQEALTNVRRHAEAGAATVRLDYGEEELEVGIEDDGRGPAGASAGDGSGIDGMRERARALGGSFEAGARPEGGFRVRAHLPLGGAA
jgi:signal transduction histidine kinase